MGAAAQEHTHHSGQGGGGEFSQGQTGWFSMHARVRPNASPTAFQHRQSIDMMIRRSSYGAGAPSTNVSAHPARDDDDDGDDDDEEEEDDEEDDDNASPLAQRSGSMESIGLATATSDGKDSLDLTATIASDAEEGRDLSPSRTASFSDTALDQSTADPTTSPLVPSPARWDDGAEEVEEVTQTVPVAPSPVSKKLASPAPEMAPAIDTVEAGRRDSLNHPPQCDRKIILEPEVCCTLAICPQNSTHHTLKKISSDPSIQHLFHVLLACVFLTVLHHLRNNSLPSRTIP